MKIETIAVLGLGYIGLPTAAILASSGFRVIGVDVAEEVIATINSGKIHIIEPGLEAFVKNSVQTGNLRAVAEVESADAYIIAVPTPFKPDSHQPDLSYIKAATDMIAPVLKKGDLIILESTSPVGTTDKISQWLSDKRRDLRLPHQDLENSDVRIAHCPERVLPGQVMHELIYNDRVIGGITAKCASKAAEIYNTFVKGDIVLASTARCAEMVKLAENSFRDVNIAFANELSIICENSDISVNELIKLANMHPRVNILQPGPGVGGHCIAVDPWFIISSNPDDSQLIKTARTVNDHKTEWVIKNIASRINELKSSLLKDTLTVCCYGLAFKANIDDLRESPALYISEYLKSLPDCHLIAVEPNLSIASYNDIPLVDLNSALELSDLHVLLVDHDEFSKVRPQKGNIIDTRGTWS